MKNIRAIWIILGIYGIWFAILSGLEEISNGKYWKVILAILLAVTVYFSSRIK